MTADQIATLISQLDLIERAIQHASCNPEQMADDVGATCEVMRKLLSDAWLEALRAEVA